MHKKLGEIFKKNLSLNIQLVHNNTWFIIINLYMYTIGINMVGKRKN